MEKHYETPKIMIFCRIDDVILASGLDLGNGDRGVLDDGQW